MASADRGDDPVAVRGVHTHGHFQRSGLPFGAASHGTKLPTVKRTTRRFLVSSRGRATSAISFHHSLTPKPTPQPRPHQIHQSAFGFHGLACSRRFLPRKSFHTWPLGSGCIQ